LQSLPVSVSISGLTAQVKAGSPLVQRALFGQVPFVEVLEPKLVEQMLSTDFTNCRTVCALWG
jgi:hypothetical protein